MEDHALQLEKARIYAVLAKQSIDVLVNDLAAMFVAQKAASEPSQPLPVAEPVKSP